MSACFPSRGGLITVNQASFYRRHANCRMSAPPGENERAAAQSKESYISRHEQIMEKEQERTQRQEQEGEYYKKRRERGR
jgi:hypothetical protein